MFVSQSSAGRLIFISLPAFGGLWITRSRTALFLYLVLSLICPSRNFYFDIDAVGQGTADLVHIMLNLSRAMAQWCRITVISARTGIHGGDKHKRARELNSIFCPSKW